MYFSSIFLWVFEKQQQMSFWRRFSLISNRRLLENYKRRGILVEGEIDLKSAEECVTKRTLVGPRTPRIPCSRTRASVDGLQDAGRLERMAVINQLPRCAQLARRRGIGEESRGPRFRRLSSSPAPPSPPSPSPPPLSPPPLARFLVSSHPNLPAPRTQIILIHWTSRPQWPCPDQINDRAEVEYDDTPQQDTVLALSRRA